MTLRKRNIVVFHILLLFPVWANIHQLAVEWKMFRVVSAPYDFPRLGAETADFHKYLAAQQTTEFLSDVEDDVSGVEMLQLQYELVPTKLVRSADTKYVVGRIHNIPAMNALLAKTNLRVVKAYSDGVVLLSRIN